MARFVAKFFSYTLPIDRIDRYPSGTLKRYSLSDDADSDRDYDIDYEAQLNDQQLEVVRARGGHMLVIAGAGSGKTHTLTYRVAHLLESGVDADRILLLTFTNKAAQSMTDRVSGLLGEQLRQMWSGTFHSIANRTLRREAEALGYESDYTILDTEDSRTLMKACRAESDVDHTEEHFPKPKTLHSIYSYCINTQQRIEEVLKDKYDYLLEQRPNIPSDIRPILRLYQSRKREMNLMDFDDLLLNWKHLLRDHEGIRQRYAERFKHVLVDEYHDTNHIQGEIIDMLSARHENLMVVGDDCQSIYAFRGADYRNILEFPDRHPDCETYRLELNYRSTPEILALANHSIRHNEHQFQKTLQAQRPSGPPPALVKLRDQEQQAAFVSKRILELADEGYDYSDIGVLYRSHHHSMELQVELTRRNIPFVVRSGLRFFEKAHIKDALAYLKFLFNPKDELSFLRVAQMGTGIGSSRAQDIWLYVSSKSDPLEALDDERLVESLPGRASKAWRRLARQLTTLRDMRMDPPGEMIEALLKMGYSDYLKDNFENPRDREDDLLQLADFAQGFPDLDRFLGEISLLTNVSGKGVLVGEKRDDYVTLSSVHQAKGLEWPVIFLLGLSEGQFPHHRAMEDQAGVEEERRLFYVAVTRARDELYLCHPVRAGGRGRRRFEIQRASLFIRELREDPNLEEVPWEKWVIEE